MMFAGRLRANGFPSRSRNSLLTGPNTPEGRVSLGRSSLVCLKPNGRARLAFERKSLILLALLLALWSLAAPAWGGGFTLSQQGTAAMAQGAAFVAEADDPSAIFYNPAGLNQLKRPEIYMGAIFEHPDRDFFGPAGQPSETNHR